MSNYFERSKKLREAATKLPWRRQSKYSKDSLSDVFGTMRAREGLFIDRQPEKDDPDFLVCRTSGNFKNTREMEANREYIVHAANNLPKIESLLKYADGVLEIISKGMHRTSLDLKSEAGTAMEHIRTELQEMAGKK